MAHNFLPYDQDQLFLMPPSLKEWVADGSLARFISEVVDEFDRSGELSEFYVRYRADGWGRAAYHPCMVVKVLLYGYAVGVCSSRKLAQALDQDVGFRYLAANQQPDFRTVSDFRKEHLAALAGLFVKVLELCKGAGLVQLGRVALDGRRVAGNAAIERSHSRRELERLVKQILQEAEETDAREDELYGAENRGDELPEGWRTEAERLKRIREAVAQINARKKEIHEAQMERRREWEEKKQRGERTYGPKPPEAPRKRDLRRLEKMKANTTDPESRIVKGRRGFMQGYNGQAMVECESQVIVAQGLTAEADDRQHLPLMLERCEAQAGNRPAVCLADAGYWSESNAQLEDSRTEFFIAVDREARMIGNDPRKLKRGALNQPEARRMRAKLKTDRGREIYRERGQTVEPVFGQMCMRGLQRFGLRGMRKVQTEWSLWCTTHNLLKLWRAGWVPQPA